MIIATVRGFLLNFGVYHATRSALMLPFEVRAAALCAHSCRRLRAHTALVSQWSPAITFITCFVTMFATVIAITKVPPLCCAAAFAFVRADGPSAGPTGCGG